MLNGSTLPFEMDGEVKVFRLTAEPVTREFAPGMIVNCWGYNGQTPGPVIEAVEGDRVRIIVENKLKEPTTIHWHGIIVPNRMDGVTGLNQAPIQPGESFTYEFVLKQNGTFMYHPHYDEVIQIGMGMMGFFIIHPKKQQEPKIDRDYLIMLSEWQIPIGSATPNPLSKDFNYFTFNSKLYPGIDPIVAKTGERVRLRLGNLSLDSHPIHIHGHEFTVTRHGAKRLPEGAQYTEVTVNVPVGSTRDIEFIADNPGDWAVHCHISHHTMNGMVHNLSNTIHTNQDKVRQVLQDVMPEYMPMGEFGMGAMYDGRHHHGTKIPNFLGFGSPGPYGTIEMSGMFTILKIRDNLTHYKDPGWYE